VREDEVVGFNGFNAGDNDGLLVGWSGGVPGPSVGDWTFAATMAENEVPDF
jgi:hypothetical protein